MQRYGAAGPRQAVLPVPEGAALTTERVYPPRSLCAYKQIGPDNVGSSITTGLSLVPRRS